MKKILLAAALIISSSVMTFGQLAWVNEFHYDNTGSDTGEFIEVFVSNAYAGNLSDLSVVKYNGSSGEHYGSYDSLDFILSDTIAAGSFYRIATIPLQNGSPDGFVLNDSSLGIIQFLSYEGSFTAVDGIASGLLSTDVGVSEPGSSPVGSSLGLTGVGSSYTDFNWSNFARNTAGSINSDQQINAIASSAVPEPSTYGLIFSLAALALIVTRLRRK